MEIRLIKDNEYINCENILRSLPEWFGIESAIVDYITDIKAMNTYLAILDGIIVGFISINLHNKYTAEIHVMGIKKDFHNKKIGTQLINYIEDILRKDNFEYLEVKTLSESHPDINYKKTRDFYLSRNFRPIQEIKELWGEHNPCLLMIKKL